MLDCVVFLYLISCDMLVYICLWHELFLTRLFNFQQNLLPSMSAHLIAWLYCVCL